MVRLWRILVLMLAVMPLTMPMVGWSATSQCKARMAMGHECCPQHAKVTAPACCTMKADSFLAERENAADKVRSIAVSQAFFSAPFVKREETRGMREPDVAYIPILLPTLILRT